jgi:hypothetical protein
VHRGDLRVHLVRDGAVGMPAYVCWTGRRSSARELFDHLVEHLQRRAPFDADSGSANGVDVEHALRSAFAKTSRSSSFVITSAQSTSVRATLVQGMPLTTATSSGCSDWA